jgi:hypothetical protein
MGAGVALLALRKKEPSLVRPFKIPHLAIAVVFTCVSGGLAGGSVSDVCNARTCLFAVLLQFCAFF